MGGGGGSASSCGGVVAPMVVEDGGAVVVVATLAPLICIQEAVRAVYYSCGSGVVEVWCL